MIFGAGIFALPYTFSKAGIFWGIIHFLIAFLILIFLHFLYGEVAYYTKGRHRFTGYVELFLGRRAKQLAFITTIASYYGTLLIYGLLAGLFLSNFLNGSHRTEISLLFFIAAGLIIFLRMTRIAEINFYLTIPLFVFIIYLLFVSFPSIRIENFVLGSVLNANWFLPYGVWLFALAGFAALPEARDIFAGQGIRHFKKVIFISLAVSALFYFLFVFAVWGVSGLATSEDALSGLINILGRKALLAGSLIGFLAVFTSYLALAIDMKNIFSFDYKIPKFFSWFLTVIPPILLFFLGATDFVRILGIIGVLGLGTLGIFIIFMAKKLRKRIRDNDPGDILEDVKMEYSQPAKVLQIIVLAGIIAGVAYELWRIFV
jgi:amino acid permease